MASSEVAARRDGVRATGRRSRVGQFAHGVDTRVRTRGVVGSVPGSPGADLSGRPLLVARRRRCNRRRLRGDVWLAAGRRIRGSGRARRAVRRAARERRPRNRPKPGDLRHCHCSGRAPSRRATVARLARSGTSSAGAASCGGCGHGPGEPRVAGMGDRDRREHLNARHDRSSRRSVASTRRRGRDHGVAAASTGSVRAGRRTANRGGYQYARAARAGTRRPDARRCIPTRRWSVRRCNRPADRTAAGGRPCRYGRDRGRRRSRGADSRPGVARRTGARGVGSCNGRARARERASGGSGTFTAGGGAGVARPHRRRR